MGVEAAISTLWGGAGKKTRVSVVGVERPWSPDRKQVKATRSHRVAMAGLESHALVRPGHLAKEMTRIDTAQVVLALTERPLHIASAPAVLLGSYRGATEAIRGTYHIAFTIPNMRYSVSEYYWVLFDTLIIINACHAPGPSRDGISISQSDEVIADSTSATKDELSRLVAEIKTHAQNIAERNFQMVKLIDEYRERWRVERRGVRKSD